MKKWVEPRAEVVSTTGIAEPSGTHGEVRAYIEFRETRVPVVVVRDQSSSLVDTVPSAEEGGGHHKSDCGTKAPENGVCYAPQLKHAPFKWSKAALSMFIVFSGMILSWLLCVQLYARKNKALVGLTQRNKVLGAGYAFLANKYYLDHLYELVIVRSIAHPIARGAYWINQNVLDGIVNGAGIGSRRIAGWVYRNVDQKVVDAAVNGTGSAAQGAGGALQPVQSGKVNQYGALLFGAAAIGALVLVIINT